MGTPGISPTQLKRCRSLVLTDIGIKDEFRWKIEVLDPRMENRALNTLFARTPQDLSRMKRSMIVKYRIPQENISIIEKEEETVDLVLPKKKRGRPPKENGGSDGTGTNERAS